MQSARAVCQPGNPRPGSFPMACPASGRVVLKWAGEPMLFQQPDGVGAAPAAASSSCRHLTALHAGRAAHLPTWPSTLQAPNIQSEDKPRPPMDVESGDGPCAYAAICSGRHVAPPRVAQEPGGLAHRRSGGPRWACSNVSSSRNRSLAREAMKCDELGMAHGDTKGNKTRSLGGLSPPEFCP